MKSVSSTTASTSSQLSVIVPVYNEGAKILSNLDLLISEIEPHFSHFEVIVVSDGSTDDTNKSISTYQHPRVRSILLPKNQGKGAAVRRGFFEATGDYILFIDGGMELHPREIRIFLGLMELYEADLVIGSKRHPQSQVEYPAIRRLLSSIFQRIIRMLFDFDVTDTQVGIKLFRGEVIRKIRDELEIDRYGFDIELLALSRAHGYKRMLEAPVRLDYFRRSLRTPLTDLIHTFKIGLYLIADVWRTHQKLKRLKLL